jgi:diadenosine tetraphosphatase ApaH/serine/threonine PP2A family protein phosphatase
MERPGGSRRARILTALGALGLGAGVLGAAALGAGVPRGGSSGAAEAPFRDGPYVTWSADGTAETAAVCGTKVERRTLPGRGKPTLPAPCGAPGALSRLDPAPPAPPPSAYAGVDRIFAVSDVEGNLRALRRLLERHRVLDARGRWTFGEGHLVLVGDLVDRGDEVTEVLWLVHRLEQEALRAGGRVHYVLGNHEAMLLLGDTRYVHPKYEAAARRLGTSVADLFGPRTEFGRWLRAKNALVKVNDLLFVHGGISPAAARLAPDLEAMNGAVRQGLADPARAGRDPSLALLLGEQGPLWYRGYLVDPRLSSWDVDAGLSRFGARAVVVGHTIVERITPLHAGRVLAIDTTFKDADRAEGLLWRRGRLFRALPSGGVQPLE